MKFSICIGAPRAGTTWLYENLRMHPQIFTPPIKEVRHFIGHGTVESRRTIAGSIIRYTKCPRDIEWVNNWCAADANNEAAYRDMMCDTPLPFAIDISPIYCTAKPEIAQKFKSALGDDTRIIFIMRNPIERDYSHAKRHFHMEKKTAQLPLEEYLAFLDRPTMQRRNDYLRTIETWTGIFGRDAVHLDFFDNIAAEPQSMLAKILAHIGAENMPIFDDTAAVRFGTYEELDDVIPKEIKPILAKRHMPMLERLAEAFPNPCGAWLEDGRKLAA